MGGEESSLDRNYFVVQSKPITHRHGGTSVDVTDALERIGAIHSHLAKAEEYRGYRPAALAASGLLGLLAALAQPWLTAQDDPSAFLLRYWIAAGLACAALAGSATAIGYLRQEDEFARRRSRTVMLQFLPLPARGRRRDGDAGPAGPACRQRGLAAGAVDAPVRPGHGGVAAVFCRAWRWRWRRGISWPAGCCCPSSRGPVPSGWSVGLPFGIGQLLAAGVLYTARRSEVET